MLLVCRVPETRHQGIDITRLPFFPRRSLSLLFSAALSACGGETVATERLHGDEPSFHDPAEDLLEPGRDAGSAEQPGSDLEPSPSDGLGAGGSGSPASADPEAGPDLSTTPSADTPTQPVQPTPATPRCGASGASTASSADAVARSLARSLWGGEPDEQLLVAVGALDLTDPEGLEAEVRRLLDDPRATEHLAAFGEWWLAGVDGRPRPIVKDPASFPEFTPQLEAAIRQEAREFTASVVGDPDGTLSTLLGAPYGFANETLAPLYGKSVAGAEFQRVEFDEAERAGLFTQAYFLSATSGLESNPVRRGFLLRERLLCAVIPPTPALGEEPSIPEGTTVRQYWEATVGEPSCWGCHQLGTGLGFGFEHYDALGRYRTEQAGQPIDARAIVANVDGEP